MAYPSQGSAATQYLNWNGTYPIWRDPTVAAVDITVQGILGSSRWSYLRGVNGATLPLAIPASSAWSFTMPSSTVQNPNWTTGWLSIAKQLGVSSAAAASALEALHTNEFSFSNTVSWGGGFFYLHRGGIHTSVASMRSFFGLAVGGTFGNVDPSSIVNMAGFGADAADTNLQFMQNDGAGTATKTDLGASFPARSNAADFYEFRIFAAAGQIASIQYKVLNIISGATASGTVTTDLPAGNALLRPRWWLHNNGTASAMTYGMTATYVQSDW